jgi:hypothetical protein
MSTKHIKDEEDQLDTVEMGSVKHGGSAKAQPVHISKKVADHDNNHDSDEEGDPIALPTKADHGHHDVSYTSFVNSFLR